MDDDVCFASSLSLRIRLFKAMAISFQFNVSNFHLASNNFGCHDIQLLNSFFEVNHSQGLSVYLQFILFSQQAYLFSLLDIDSQYCSFGIE